MMEVLRAGSKRKGLQVPQERQRCPLTDFLCPRPVTPRREGWGCFTELFPTRQDRKIFWV